MSVSGNESLGGTSYGGSTSSPNGGGSITSGDVKGTSDVNVWDEEW